MDTSRCSFIITRLMNLYFLQRNKRILRKEEYKVQCTNKHLTTKQGFHKPHCSNIH